MMKENNNTGTVSNTTVDERSISMTRKVMKIVGRNRKTDSTWLSDHLKINPYVGRLAALIAEVDNNPSSVIESKSELDNHVNMVVAGSQCVVFDDTKKTCTVNSFSESAGRLDNIRIVDIVMAYDCPFKSKTYLLLMRNALHIPELPLNLLPPFIMREGGIIVDECPKSQSQHPSIENH